MQASKSDYFTHIRDIPPQYGDGVFEDNAKVRQTAALLDGTDAASPWNHPDKAHPTMKSIEPLTPQMDMGECVAKSARHTTDLFRVYQHFSV